jgi:peptidoglycan hydrolase-like protein with peptidoglycan-binding domain
MPTSSSELVFQQTEVPDVDRRVVLIQLTLFDRKLYHGKADGLFGPKTDVAVRKLQAQGGLAENGRVDKITGELLGLPFWTENITKELDTPYRDEKKFPAGTKFDFHSDAGSGYFFSHWPNSGYDSSNILTRRALRANNPGALNISKWQKQLPGYVGETKPDSSPNKNRTTIYSSPEAGVSAWGYLLRQIYFKGKKDKVSVGAIIDKYRGGIPRDPYLAGYAKYSNGKLVEDYMIDLYDAGELATLAIAAFSHEFGGWYPLTDEQLRAGFAIAEEDSDVSAASRATFSDREEDEEDAEFEDGFAEDFDVFGSLTSASRSSVSRAEHLGLDDAKWPSDSKNAPDTWHLPTPVSETKFQMTADVVMSLVSAGSYRPDVTTNGRLIVALRGCVLADGTEEVEDAGSIDVMATAPDHEHFRCLIGSVDLANKTLSLYTASTVPRRTGMLRFYNKMNFGTKGKNCNMLPTGCYELCVGTHGGTNGPVEYVLRLGDGPTSADAGQALVLRTTNDLIYGTMDIWDNTKPADNIHPAFLDVSFSSLGCLTVRGTQEQGGSYKTATGEWLKFRKNTGFNGAHYGKRFDCLLTTGYEAAAVAKAMSDGSELKALFCLRQGSQGDVVKQLQEQLGIDPSDGQFGPLTGEALVAIQRSKIGFTTGTWSPAMAALLGWKFG